MLIATALQPLYPSAFGPWSAVHEAEYQRLRALCAPLLSDDINVRLTALKAKTAAECVAQFERYAEHRFARLTAWLRKREPADAINYSILVYRLSEQDVAQALEGPPP